MKRFLFSFLILAFILAVALPGSAGAQPPESGTWSSVIAYMNPTTKGAELQVLYYNPDGTNPSGSIQAPLPINAHQSGILLVGSTYLSEFRGSAVVSSSEQLLAVYKQEAGGDEVYSPLLYTSFDATQAGTGVYYLPRVQAANVYDSQLGIQNLEGFDVDISLTLYPVGGGSLGPYVAPGSPAKAFSSLIFNMSEVTSGFNGSVVVTARRVGDPGTNGRVVAAVQEIQAMSHKGYAFEGSGVGATRLYSPSASCLSGKGQQTTYFDIQNAGAGSTNVTVQYYDWTGAEISSYTYTGLTAGSKIEINVCDFPNNSTHYDAVYAKNLSAVITSSAEPLAGVGRVVGSDGLATAFSLQARPSDGVSLGCGRYRVVLPYIDYSTRSNGFRTYVTVMNVNDVNPAADIQAKYYGRDGSLLATQVIAGSSTPLALYAKRSTSPDTASGLVTAGSRGFFGSLVIESDVPVIALARVQRSVDDKSGKLTLGEDYNGIPYAELDCSP